MSAVMTADRLLPVGFETLDRFADWAVPDEAQRYAKRIGTSLTELRQVYDAVLPLLDAALLEVDRYPYNALPADVRRLYELLLAMMEIGLAIEIFKSSDVPKAVPASRIEILDAPLKH